jgi:propanediol utilization protein
MSINNIIRDYYLLCSSSIGQKKHHISELETKNLEIVFTKKEINLYLREKEPGIYIARETIVGGRQVSEYNDLNAIIIN